MCMREANYIVGKTNERNQLRSGIGETVHMTAKRLQKLLFFSFINFQLKNNGEPMFKDDFYAWDSGPVIPDVYFAFDKYENGNMIPLRSDWLDISDEKRKSIDEVLDLTWTASVPELVEESHVEGGPWAKVYEKDDPYHDQEITKESIYKYYSENDCKYISH